MKYWFRNSPKYNIGKPICAEGWLLIVGYFVIAVGTVYAADLVSLGNRMTFLIILVVALLVESLAFSYLRETRTDPASRKKIASPKIKGGKKKKLF
ncbi:MAG: hypothetical protein II940_01480 [Methanosarcinaceae archaeon]|nr:hypothetical protein [Methanosarcinaceae archaeon]